MTSFLVTSCALIVAIAFLLFLICKRQFSFWMRRGVLTPPVSFLGHLKDVAFQRKTLAVTMVDIYKLFKSKGVPHGGIYNFFCPVYVPVDINIIKSILQIDFEHFTDRGIYFNEKDDPLSVNLFSQEGNKWKVLKSKLSPTFTSGKLKTMFATIVHCTNEMDVILKNMKGKPLNIKDITARYATDVIGNCAFGIECNSLKEPNNEFRERGSAFFERTLIENFMLYFSDSIPKLMKLIRLRVNRPEVSDFFMSLIRDTIAYRKEKHIYRKDFLHFLMQLENGERLHDDQELEEEKVDKLSFEEICAQSFLFFIAGFETSSATISFCLYLLAMHEEIQDKVRKEIISVIEQNDGKLTYDSLSEMEYLERVINETLRMYPISSILNRICTKDYKVPGTDLLLKKGQRVHVPVMGVHYDEEFYPDPEKFNPDRFYEENKKNTNFMTFLAFGDGPRICPGLRFGMIETKLALFALLRRHKFYLNKKTNVPVEFDFKHPLLSPKGGIWLDFVEMND